MRGLSLVGLGGGSNPALWGVWITLAMLYAVWKALSVLGRTHTRLPLMLASNTRAGEVGILICYCLFVAFGIVGLVAALVNRG